MPVESSANNISQLNQNYPTAEDYVSEGDDHIRLIKKTVKQTFSKVTDLVSVSHKQLNTLAQALKDETDTKKGIVLADTSIKAKDIVDGNVITRSLLIQMVYPVGALFATTQSGNPNTYLGFGQWELLPDGTGLLSYNSNINKVEGENSPVVPVQQHTHSITLESAGSHTHGFPANLQASKDGHGRATWCNSGSQHPTTSAGDHTHKASIANTGTKDATLDTRGKHMRVHIWHRTA